MPNLHFLRQKIALVEDGFDARDPNAVHDPVHLTFLK